MGLYFMSILFVEALSKLHVRKLVKNIVVDCKITFLQSITIYFVEQDHRWKIKNVVVADRVLINAFSIVACMCDTTTSPVFFFFFCFFINLSILSYR